MVLGIKSTLYIFYIALAEQGLRWVKCCHEHLATCSKAGLLELPLCTCVQSEIDLKFCNVI